MLCGENKGADKLRGSNSAADQPLCLCFQKSRFSHETANLVAFLFIFDL